MTETKTAVVILNWNGKHFMQQFLAQVASSIEICGDGAKLFVADNGSTDGSVEWLRAAVPQAELIAFDTNYGFTGGYNRALRLIKAEYYVLLNSDIEVTDNWLQPLVQYLDRHPETAACAPKLLAFHDRSRFEYAGACGGFIDKYGYPFCRGRILDSLEQDRGQYDTSLDVFWATGAAMTVRAELYHKAGALDEDFFAHMEEIDLCWRLQLMGYTIASVPESAVYHVGGGALPVNSPRKLFFNYRNNLLMLVKNSQKNTVVRISARLALDVVSGLVYLASGKFAFFAAVVRAHLAFFRLLPKFIAKRKSIKNELVINPTAKIYSGSIVYQYFKSRKRLVFSSLK
jgi:GT2 family glycosyltransferase